MPKFIYVLPFVFGVAACETPQQTAFAGAATGAALGAAASKDGNKVQGAALGGAVGLVAGSLIGKANTPGQCVYRDAYGRQYVAAC